jgi:hypothetical protein
VSIKSKEGYRTTLVSKWENLFTLWLWQSSSPAELAIFKFKLSTWLGRAVKQLRVLANAYTAPTGNSNGKKAQSQ